MAPVDKYIGFSACRDECLQRHRNPDPILGGPKVVSPTGGASIPAGRPGLGRRSSLEALATGVRFWGVARLQVGAAGVGVWARAAVASARKQAREERIRREVNLGREPTS